MVIVQVIGDCKDDSAVAHEQMQKCRCSEKCRSADEVLSRCRGDAEVIQRC